MGFDFLIEEMKLFWVRVAGENVSWRMTTEGGGRIVRVRASIKFEANKEEGSIDRIESIPNRS